MGWRYWYWPRGWWCPRHPWPPAWARGWWYPAPYPYPVDPSEELKALEALKRDLEADLADLAKRIEELKREYNGGSRALELIELPGERYYLKLKREYMEVVKRILRKPVLSRGVMRTLSFIAYHQPIEQSRVAEARGSSAYRHVRILLEKGLVEAEKSGRTLILRTSPLFAELFGVENDPRR